MNLEIITREDLREFKKELFAELAKFLQTGRAGNEKTWLKSNEVRKLLKISPGTLQNLRINGPLNYTRIGSIHYYRLEDIDQLLEGGVQ